MTRTLGILSLLAWILGCTGAADDGLDRHFACDDGEPDGGGDGDGDGDDDSPTPGGEGLLFASGWDSTAATGCNFEALIDGVWDDYGGSGACNGSVHDADIVTDVAHDGARSLRVTQKPGFINGTDFRIVEMFGPQTDVTLIAWVYYSPNYRWASADHKIFIAMDPDQTAQNVYINYRGGSDARHARLCAGITPVDSVYCADSPQVTVDTWYRLRVHIVGGEHGSVDVWLQPDGEDEVQLDLTHDAGSVVDIDDVDTGELGGVKYDTTYNAGGSISELMYQYVDSVEVYQGSIDER